MPTPIFCYDCGATGSVNRVTATLQCKCGSTDLGLEGFDEKPQKTAAPHGNGTGWGHQSHDPLEGWNEYQGPTPDPTPLTVDEENADVTNGVRPRRPGENEHIPGGGYNVRDYFDQDGDYHAPTSQPNTESLDATTQGPAVGGARWDGTKTKYTSSIPEMNTSSSVPVLVTYSDGSTWSNVTSSIKPEAPLKKTVAKVDKTAELIQHITANNPGISKDQATVLANRTLAKLGENA